VQIIYLWFYSPCGPWLLFRLLNLRTIGRTLWTGDQSVSKPLLTHRTTQKRNKRTQTSMPRMGFEPMITEFELAKKVHALDRAGTVFSHSHSHSHTHTYTHIQNVCKCVSISLAGLNKLIHLFVSNERIEAEE
jgi:hypothetical protein